MAESKVKKKTVIKKATKKNNNADKGKSAQFTRSPYSEAKRLDYFQERGDRQRWIAAQLDEFSKTPECLSIWDFCDQYGIPEQTYYDSIKINSDLNTVHLMARKRIGARRERMAIFRSKNCNEKTIISTLRLYNSDWKEVYDEEQRNKKELAESGTNEPVTIKIERD